MSYSHAAAYSIIISINAPGLFKSVYTNTVQWETLTNLMNQSKFAKSIYPLK